jgi:SAM-dependent methyltransferase
MQKRNRALPFWLGAVVAACAARAFGQTPERDPDVPYVPTPDVVVQAMLKMAHVNKNDVLYDLGCGDGRIVITAARRFGIRAVGVDIDPERIQESKANAKKAGVEGRVAFVVKDLFNTQVGRASVVTLYLLPEINVKLRPKLLRELRPGTRVVSHDFDMADWEPDRTASVRSTRGHTLYYWVIPANVQGVWRWSMPVGSGGQSGRVNLNQHFQEVSGTAAIGGSRIPITNAKLTGNLLSFSVPTQARGKEVTMRFSGRVTGNALKGVLQVEGGPSAGKRDWVAKRSGSTAAASR